MQIPLHTDKWCFMHCRWPSSSQAPLPPCRSQLRLCQCQLHRRKLPLLLFFLLHHLILPHLWPCWSYSSALRAHISCLLLFLLTWRLTSSHLPMLSAKSELSFNDYIHSVPWYLCVLVHVGFEIRFYRYISKVPARAYKLWAAGLAQVLL